MPILMLNSAAPPTAIANKTPTVQIAVPQNEQSQNDEVLKEILVKLAAIEKQLGVEIEPVLDPVEKEAIAQRMALLRAAKDEKMRIEKDKRDAFVKRMKKGKKKAAKARGEL